MCCLAQSADYYSILNDLRPVTQTAETTLALTGGAAGTQSPPFLESFPGVSSGSNLVRNSWRLNIWLLLEPVVCGMRSMLLRGVDGGVFWMREALLSSIAFLCKRGGQE